MNSLKILERYQNNNGIINMYDEIGSDYVEKEIMIWHWHLISKC